MKPRVRTLPWLLSVGDAREDERIAVVVQTASLRVVTPERGSAGNSGPAIWIHPGRLDRSLILGAGPGAQLSIFDLDGLELQSMAVQGHIDGIDLAYDVKVGPTRTDVAVVTDRGQERLLVFRIDPAAAATGAPPLIDITSRDSRLLLACTQLDVVARRPDMAGPRFAFISHPDRVEAAAFEVGSQAPARSRAISGRVMPRDVADQVVVCRLPLSDDDTQPRGRAWKRLS
jgi:myo-inositol-hexaphosphate 3-phosphohydrolase